MRWIRLMLCLGIGFGLGSASAAPRASNPAFLGIQMQDMTGRGPCVIEGATRDSPAEAAGLVRGDVVIAVDGKPIASCAVLLDEITGHVPGDAVQIKLQRQGASTPLVIAVQLTTRDALLQKVIGKPMVDTYLVGVGDGEIYDLSALRTTAIVGLYNPACVECPQLFTRMLDWSRSKARRGGPKVLVLAVTSSDSLRDLRPELLQRSLDVPLATGNLISPAHTGSPFSRELVISDRDRLGVLVIDASGIVQYAGPIAPDSDDADALLDELFAAVVQAQLRSK